MILFIGDFVRLHDEQEWLAVTDIEPYDICVLQNGIRVCASEEYIAEAKSCNEFMAAGRKNTQSRPWPRGH